MRQNIIWALGQASFRGGVCSASLNYNIKLMKLFSRVFIEVLLIALLFSVFSSCRQPQKGQNVVGDKESFAESPGEEPLAPVAQVLFIPPPKSKTHPEWEYLTEAFRSGSKEAFARANWKFTELDLSQILFTRWRDEILKSIVVHPALIFSFGDVYAQFLREAAWDSGIGATVVLALAKPSTQASPNLIELRFHVEELGFLAGVMCAQLTLTGHSAVFAYEDDLYSDLFVAGFAQGLKLERSGAILKDLRVKRHELINGEGEERLVELFTNANKGLDPRLGIGAVASFLGPLGDPFMSALAERGTVVINSFVPKGRKTPPMFLTTMVLSFSKLPMFVVDNAKRLKLLELLPVNRPVPSKEDGSPLTARSNGVTHYTGPRYYEVRLSDGLMGHSGFNDYRRFKSLPTGFDDTVNYYIEAVSAGEIRVKESLP